MSDRIAEIRAKLDDPNIAASRSVRDDIRYLLDEVEELKLACAALRERGES